MLLNKMVTRIHKHAQHHHAQCGKHPVHPLLRQQIETAFKRIGILIGLKPSHQQCKHKYQQSRCHYDSFPAKMTLVAVLMTWCYILLMHAHGVAPVKTVTEHIHKQPHRHSYHKQDKEYPD